MSTFHAANPLPIARHLVVSISTPLTPLAMIDQLGRRYPTQQHRDDYGPTLLVGVHLGALEAVRLEPLAETVADARWEVDAKTLDNGRVRGEFDATGQLVRLCWDGVFADLTGPAVVPFVDEQPLVAETVITVLENGPVRARLGVTLTTADGVLELTYSLHTHSDGLEITAVWSGPGQLTLAHPTAHHRSLLHAALLGPRQILTQPAALDAVRWAALDDAAARGLAVVAGQPLAVSAQDGVLCLHGEHLAYALHHAHRDPEQLSLGQLAVAHGVPGRSAAELAAAPFHLADLGGLVPIDTSIPSGWAGEVCFAEQAGARGRAFLFPHPAAKEAWRVDDTGALLTPISLTREGDGLELDHQPGETFAVRWR